MNKSAKSAAGITLASISVAAYADNSFTVNPEPPLPKTTVPAPPATVAPVLSPSAPPAVAAPPAPPTPPSTDVLTPEGTALAAAATASAGYPLTDDEAAEVTHQMGPYPAPIKDLREFHLSNGDAPNMVVTPSLRPKVAKTILGVKI